MAETEKIVVNLGSKEEGGRRNLIDKVAFVNEYRSMKIFENYSECINRLFEDVFDARLTSIIVMMACGGVVCWPDDGEETKFEFNYHNPVNTPTKVAYDFRRYCNDKGIDFNQLMLSLVVDTAKPEWREYKEFLDKARQVL